MATRIMVVDDELLICQLLTYQLNGAGYAVSSVQSGREALKRMLLEEPDLILLDVMIGDMSGWEVCRHIRATSTVPIIMLTAKGADGDVVTGLNVGADDYITKPFSMNQLLARVEAVLRRTRTARMPHPVHNSATEAVNDPHLRYAPEFYTLPEGSPDNPPTPAPAGPKESPQYQAHPAAPPADELPATSVGRQFFEARKLRGLTLHQAETACGVRWDFLQALEREHFEYMPRVQLRHALKAYSAFLGLDVDELLGKAEPPAPRQPQWSIPVAMAATVVLVLIVMLGFHLL
jgi:DNA-binding response OmpR family regulator